MVNGIYETFIQEFEALVTLSKAGILELNTLELEDNVDVSAVAPEDLARLLASCKWFDFLATSLQTLLFENIREGFELSGVRLTQPQWEALVEKAYKGDEWAPKYLSLEDFSTMNQTMG